MLTVCLPLNSYCTGPLYGLSHLPSMYGDMELAFSLAGEEPNSGIIASITPGMSTLITCVEDDRLAFQAS